MLDRISERQISATIAKKKKKMDKQRLKCQVEGSSQSTLPSKPAYPSQSVLPGPNNLVSQREAEMFRWQQERMSQPPMLQSRPENGSVDMGMDGLVRGDRKSGEKRDKKREKEREKGAKAEEKEVKAAMKLHWLVIDNI